MSSPQTPKQQPILRLRNLSKTFSGQKVLDSADLSIFAGEIHGLVGQNGSGKSTLIKVLAGYYLPDPGAEISINGGGYHELTASAMKNLIGFVHQDLALVPNMDVADNLALGREYRKSRWGLISWREEHALARELLARLGQSIDTRRKVGELSAVQRTCVAVARAIEGLDEGAKVLVLDEPTASLPEAEANILFDVLRRAAADGTGMLYVSHNVDEIVNLTRRVTVLRDGRVVHSGHTDAVDHDTIVSLILGRPPEPSLNVRAASLESAQGSAVVLNAVGMRHPQSDTTFSLQARAGEVVGIAGLDGSGREDVCPLLAGAVAPAAGTVSIANRSVERGNVRAAIQAGAAYVPSDRHRDGLIAGSNVRENITVSRLSSLVQKMVLGRARERRDVTQWIDLVDLRPPDPESDVFRLSGGNQQKVVIARALRTDPSALILDEPTKAVDVGAAAAIWTLIKNRAAAGAAVVCSSVDAEELADNCTRVIVFRRGSPAAHLEGTFLTAGAIAAESTRPDREPYSEVDISNDSNIDEAKRDQAESPEAIKSHSAP